MKSGWLIAIIILLSLLLGGIIIYHFTNPRIVTIPNPVTTTPVQTGTPDSTYPATKHQFHSTPTLFKTMEYPAYDSTTYNMYPVDSFAVVVKYSNSTILQLKYDSTLFVFNNFGEKKIINLSEHFDEEIPFRQQLISEKLFKWQTPIGDIDSQVWVYTPCEPDSMVNQVTVDQTKFQNVLKEELAKQKKRGNTYKTAAEFLAAVLAGYGLNEVIKK